MGGGHKYRLKRFGLFAKCVSVSIFYFTNKVYYNIHEVMMYIIGDLKTSDTALL